MSVRRRIRSRLPRLVPIVAALALFSGVVLTLDVAAAAPPAYASCSGTRCDRAGTVELSGSSWLSGNGVNVYSNGDSASNDEGASCVAVSGAPGDSHCPAGQVYAGEKYQCVEMVNRLYLTNGWITGTWWGNGNQLYANAPSGLTKQANGHITNLKPGDVISLDYSDGLGHAGVVNSVSGTSVSIVNQNTPDVYSSATYSRGTITMVGWHGYRVIGVIHAPTSSGGSGPTYGGSDYNTDGQDDVAWLQGSTLYMIFATGNGTFGVAGSTAGMGTPD